MDLRVALAFIMFSVSLNLIGAWAGVGDFDRDVDINNVRDDLDFEFPEFTSDCTQDCGAFEGITAFANGFGEIFNEAVNVVSGIFGIMKLAIPTITGVAWFDLLVWLPMSFGILLGIANWLRGK